jgi:hypothetical protein
MCAHKYLPPSPYQCVNYYALKYGFGKSIHAQRGNDTQPWLIPTSLGIPQNMTFPGIWITFGTTLEEDRRPQGVEIEPNSQARGKKPSNGDSQHGGNSPGIPGNPGIPSEATPIVGNRPNSQFLARDFFKLIGKIPSSSRKEK